MDTKKLYAIPFGKPIIDDIEKKAVQDVLDGNIWVHGSQTKAFEASFANYTSSPFALSLSSCTAGLHLAYFQQGIGPGDEVIVPAQTHVATSHAVELVGATPIFVDADNDTGNIDIDAIESKITPRTRAITLVHFLGVPVEMDRIMHIANKHNLFVVEDCALAVGAKYKNKHVGLWGDCGAFSFYPVKHMTTIEGGMLITRHEAMAEKIRLHRAFGVDRTVGERKVPGVYDVVSLGFNYRMNEVEAAIGLKQLERVPGFINTRRQNDQVLRQELAEIEEVSILGSGNEDCQPSYYCLSVVLDEKIRSKRVDIINSLKAKGIGTSVYYPQPVPHFTYYREKYAIDENSFPNASAISYGSIALPVGPHLNEDDMRIIASEFKATLKEIGQ
jgi:perosamine synthetase